ncbi:hypothetical protein K439DRAFT_1624430 [Ramaria rubella]|nr:hypothetical protein K439DRAFT_1624430 [Ramaria rubella]
MPGTAEFGSMRMGANQHKSSMSLLLPPQLGHGGMAATATAALHAPYTSTAAPLHHPHIPGAHHHLHVDVAILRRSTPPPLTTAAAPGDPTCTLHVHGCATAQPPHTPRCTRTWPHTTTPVLPSHDTPPRLDYLQPGSMPPSTSPVDLRRTPPPANRKPHHSYAHTLSLTPPMLTMTQHQCQCQIGEGHTSATAMTIASGYWDHSWPLGTIDFHPRETIDMLSLFYKDLID